MGKTGVQSRKAAMRSTTEDVVCWGRFSIERWDMMLAATDKGLCYASADDEKDFARHMRRWYPDHRLVRDERALQSYAEQLKEYFDGRRTVLDVPLDVRGTPFQLSVWNALRRIPYGETRSYREIAEAIGKPSAVRATGGAIGANPVMIAIPCHRVIGSDGSLTGFSGGLEWKSWLLQLEGASASASVV